MSDAQAENTQQDILDKAVAEGGAYEVLHKRLQEQGLRLRQNTEALNEQRLQEFGSSQMEVTGRVRIRTRTTASPAISSRSATGCCSATTCSSA